MSYCDHKCVVHMGFLHPIAFDILNCSDRNKQTAHGRGLFVQREKKRADYLLRRQEHRVDHMDDTIRSFDVGDDNLDIFVQVYIAHVYFDVNRLAS